MSQDPDTLIDALTRLDAILAREDQALRSFDLPAITQAAEAKLELDTVIVAAWDPIPTEIPGGAWTPAQRATMLELRTRVITQGRRNQQRLRASLDVVRGLVDHLTGAPRTGYGRAHPLTASTSAVLASDFG